MRLLWAVTTFSAVARCAPSSDGSVASDDEDFDRWDVNTLLQWGIAKLGDGAARGRGFDALERAFRADAHPRPMTAHSPQGQWLATLIGRWHVERVAYDRALYWYGKAMAEGPPQQNDCLSMQMATLVTPYPKGVDDAADVMATYARRMAALVAKPGGLSVEGVQDADPYVYCMSTTFYHEAYLEADLRASLHQHYLVALRAFPDLAYTAPLTCASRAKPRLGVASAFFGQSSVTADFGNTFARLSRDLFEEVVFIDVKERAHPSPYLLQRAADGDRVVVVDVHSDDWLARARRTVASLDLDVLLYWDLTMSRKIQRLGMSKLARVQATSHGHPCSSGIDRSVMDAYVSWGAAEVPDAQRHYTERLVLLPTLHQYYTRRIGPDGRSREDGLPFRDLRRSDFPVPAEGHWYACMQKPFKIHPAFDAMLAAVQRDDPEAHLILHDVAEDDLRAARVARFEAAGLDLRRVHFFPALPHHRLLALYDLADVVLDSYFAGGCTTTREALELGAVVVTLPAEYLGGRWSYGYLKHIGVEDTIASSEEDYVRLAVHFATDADARRDLRRRVRENVARLFEQDVAVRSWERALLDLAPTSDAARCSGVSSEA